MRIQSFSRSTVLERTWPVFLDLTVAAIALAAFYSVLLIARYWMGNSVPEVTISQSPASLPLYAFYSIVRIGVAYVLSLVFAVGYGYIAAYNPRAEALMIAALDILQSIPVLSFLPVVMLAMISLIPTRQLGVEFGAIILIFTGQVWNMAFSFYSSLKSIPRELREASSVYNFTAWQRFWQLELPFSAIGLIWNSIVSVAGGWFMLTACEMFPVGDRNFRLPGLGSWIQTAASHGDARAMIYGLIAITLIIAATDQLIWRPIIAWSDKFKFEQGGGGERVSSPILHLMRHSNAISFIQRRTITPLSEKIYVYLAARKRRHLAPPSPSKTALMRVIQWIIVIAGCALILFYGFHALLLLRDVQRHQYFRILLEAAATFARVNLALFIASAWAIPAGVAIGSNPRLARIAQPIVQIVASIPATAFFPVVLLLLLRIGSGLGVGSILLMLLGTQWYILFNVIAGAMAIPTDLKEIATLFHFSQAQRWKTVILPGIFPYLITGLVTASGGAWNASIIAEFFHLQNRTLTTFGLGAQISQATDSGQFNILLLSTIVMALMVVTINRLVWRPLYRLAETKYKLE